MCKRISKGVVELKLGVTWNCLETLHTTQYFSSLTLDALNDSASLKLTYSTDGTDRVLLYNPNPYCEVGAYSTEVRDFSDSNEGAVSVIVESWSRVSEGFLTFEGSSCRDTVGWREKDE